MTTIVLTEAIHQAGIDLLTARRDLRLVVAEPGHPAFEAALPDAVQEGARAMAIAMARNTLGGIDGRLDPSCIVDPAPVA